MFIYFFTKLDKQSVAQLVSLWWWLPPPFPCLLHPFHQQLLLWSQLLLLGQRLLWSRHSLWSHFLFPFDWCPSLVLESRLLWLEWSNTNMNMRRWVWRGSCSSRRLDWWRFQSDGISGKPNPHRQARSTRRGSWNQFALHQGRKID